MLIAQTLPDQPFPAHDDPDAIWLVVVLTKPTTTVSQWWSLITRTLAELSEEEVQAAYARIDTIGTPSYKDTFTGAPKHDFCGLASCLQRVCFPTERRPTTDWVGSVLATAWILLDMRNCTSDQTPHLFLTRRGLDRWVSWGNDCEDELEQPDVMQVHMI